MVCNNSARNLDLATRRQIASRRLQEEEGLLRDGIVKLFDVVGVVATDGNNLEIFSKATTTTIHRFADLLALPEECYSGHVRA